jgi:hypothetical protein
LLSGRSVDFSDALAVALSNVRAILLRLSHHHFTQMRDPVTACSFVQQALRESSCLAASQNFRVRWIPDPSLLAVMGRMLLQVWRVFLLVFVLLLLSR